MESTKVRRAFAALFLYLVVGGVLEAQKMLPFEWGQSEAEVRSMLGEPSESHINAISYSEVTYLGWPAELIVYLDMERRIVDGAAYTVDEASMELWSKLIEALSKEWGSPLYRYLRAPGTPPVPEAEAMERENYIRQAHWKHPEATTVAELYVTGDDLHIAVSIEPVE